MKHAQAPHWHLRSAVTSLDSACIRSEGERWRIFVPLRISLSCLSPFASLLAGGKTAWSKNRVCPGREERWKPAFGQGSANFFFKRPGSTCFQFCRLHGLLLQLLNSATKAAFDYKEWMGGASLGPQAVICWPKCRQGFLMLSN